MVQRGDIDTKNLLATGKVSEAEVIRLLGCCKVQEYRTTPHDDDASIAVHIFKPIGVAGGLPSRRWYIKFYFVEPNVVFMSVH